MAAQLTSMKGPARRVPGPVEETGDQPFARACLAEQEDRRESAFRNPREPPHLLAQRVDRSTLANQCRERRASGHSPASNALASAASRLKVSKIAEFGRSPSLPPPVTPRDFGSLVWHPVCVNCRR